MKGASTRLWASSFRPTVEDGYLEFRNWGFQISDPKSEVSDRKGGPNPAASLVRRSLSDTSDFGSEI
jgi:hypothetical protein